METAVTIPFADGEYRFWLPLPHVVELQRNTGSTIFALHDAAAAGLVLDGDRPIYGGGGSAKVDDLNEVVRLGLIGGNEGPVRDGSAEVGPLRALHLVRDYGYPSRPAVEVALIAWRVLHAAISGIDVKKKDDLTGEVEAETPSLKE